jgi:hypothetical protein
MRLVNVGGGPDASLHLLIEEDARPNGTEEDKGLGAWHIHSCCQHIDSNYDPWEQAVEKLPNAPERAVDIGTRGNLLDRITTTTEFVAQDFD